MEDLPIIWQKKIFWTKNYFLQEEMASKMNKNMCELCTKILKQLNQFEDSKTD